MSVPQQITLLTPWRGLEGSSEDQHRSELLSVQLKRTVPPKHALYGLRAKAVAMRIDRDDVLFEVEGAEMPLAVVHLTWSKETNQLWPFTTFFESWEHWVRSDMVPNHEAYS